jgi:hypothetical protein
MCVIVTHICGYPHVPRSTSIPLKNPAIICRWGSVRQKNAKGAENGNLAPGKAARCLHADATSTASCLKPTLLHCSCYKVRINTSRSSSHVRVMGLPLVLLALEAFSTSVGASCS